MAVHGATGRPGVAAQRHRPHPKTPLSRLEPRPDAAARPGAGASTDAPDPVPGWLTAWWLAWVAFVVYGSLVPFDFRPVPFDDALRRIVHAPWLDIGERGRADWIANAVLYVPVGLLTAARLAGPGVALPRRVLAALLAVAFGSVLAGAVEFVQVFFPPRTVSLNDLLAECLGSVAGAAVGALPGAWLGLLGRAFDLPAERAGPLLCRAYGVCYVLMALFPYDLLVHVGEWADKLSGPLVSLWMAQGLPGMQGATRVAGKLLAESLAVAPLGACWSARRPGAGVLRALGIGALLGVGIEGAQLCIASGVSEGVSVLTRAVGFAAGLLAWRRMHGMHVETARAAVRRASGPALVIYFGLITLLFGWWSGEVLDPDQAWQRLAREVHFTPFYYFYFTTEMRAVISLTTVVAAYAPLGVVGWSWHAGPRATAMLAFIVATVVEAGRLVWTTTRPDPTDVLIASAGAALTLVMLQRWGAAQRRWSRR